MFRTAYLALALLLSAGLSSLHAQQEITPFNIALETTAAGVTATCESGCNWTKISFSTEPYKPVYVNNQGVFGTKPAPEALTEQTFGFEINRWNNDKLVFTSWGGTAWGKLSFDLPIGKSQRMNQLGMLE